MIGNIKALLSPRWCFRDAETGGFVTKAYALLHPATTVRERVNPKPVPGPIGLADANAETGTIMGHGD